MNKDRDSICQTVPEVFPVFIPCLEMMKVRLIFPKTLSVLLAASMVSPMAALPVSAEQPLALYIDRVELNSEEIGDNRTVSVNVNISGNEKGFLAAEFGIHYDERLMLSHVDMSSQAGSGFHYTNNSAEHLLWFSGANAFASAGASEGEGKLFTLQFTLPENYATGDQYMISYNWNGCHDTSSFWYTDKGNDQIGTMLQNSISGSISIPNAEAPYLSQKELTLNQGGTAQLEIENYTGGDVLWFSDNTSVCQVENGLVTGITPGNCNVMAYVNNMLLSCQISVTQEYYYSVMDSEVIYIRDPDMVVILEYPDPTGQVVWISSDPNVVTVSEGRLTPVHSGTAQIIAASNGVSYVKTVVVELPGEITEPEPTEEPTTEEPPTEADTFLDTAEETVPDPIAHCGDLNDDGKVTLADVITLNKSLMCVEVIDNTLLMRGDTDCNGIVAPMDALILLQYVVELIDTLPFI